MFKSGSIKLIFSTSLLLLSGLLLSGILFPEKSLADAQQMKGNDTQYQKLAKKVIIFSATYCPNCLNAKEYLSSKNIPFLEFDIEKSAAARMYFDKLGGRGTPFLLVNNHPIQGFSQQEFWHHYNK